VLQSKEAAKSISHLLDPGTVINDNRRKLLSATQQQNRIYEGLGGRNEPDNSEKEHTPYVNLAIGSVPDNSTPARQQLHCLTGRSAAVCVAAGGSAEGTL
jgi:hypothetical protein